MTPLLWYRRVFVLLCLFLTALLFHLIHLDQKTPWTGNTVPVQQVTSLLQLTEAIPKRYSSTQMSTISVPSDFPNRYWNIDLTSLRENKTEKENRLLKLIGHSMCHQNPDVFKSLLDGAQKRVAHDYLKYLSISPHVQRTFESLPFQIIQGRKKKVLIVAYWRSGSTFLADLLNQLPGSFYHYEPLHSVSRIAVVEDDELKNVSLHLLDSLLKCQYDTLSDYIIWMNRRENQFLIDRNTRLAVSCRQCRSVCMNRTTLSALCEQHPMQLIKVVRLQLNATWTLFKQHPGLQVIHLVRDPRGIYNSRRNLRWMVRYKNRSDPKIFCPGMLEDLKVADQLRREFPNRFFQVQYESLSLYPFNTTKSLLSFLDFKMNQRVALYLRTHTRVRGFRRSRDPYGTHRNSQATPNRWKSILPFSEVVEVQQACREVITRLGYEFINSTRDLTNAKFRAQQEFQFGWNVGNPVDYSF